MKNRKPGQDNQIQGCVMSSNTMREINVQLSQKKDLFRWRNKSAFLPVVLTLEWETGHTSLVTS